MQRYAMLIRLRPDHAADQAVLAADPETRRWWALTDPCQEQLPGTQEQLPGTPEGHRWAPADEVWHQD